MDNPYYIGLADNPEPPEEERYPEVIAECEDCGDEIKDYEESLAVVGADGKVHHWCRYCLNRPTYSPERLIEDILETVGAFHVYGYADDNEEACRSAAERMKVTGGVRG